MRFSSRDLFLTIAFMAISVPGCLRLYHAFVPRGADFYPFTTASFQLTELESPSGKTYRVFVNDAGAMHSGNYWTWIVEDNLLSGMNVVSEGYITSEYSTGESELTVSWENDQPSVQFEPSRYSME